MKLKEIMAKSAAIFLGDDGAQWREMQQYATTLQVALSGMVRHVSQLYVPNSNCIYFEADTGSDAFEIVFLRNRRGREICFMTDGLHETFSWGKRDAEFMCALRDWLHVDGRHQQVAGMQISDRKIAEAMGLNTVR